MASGRDLAFLELVKDLTDIKNDITVFDSDSEKDDNKQERQLQQHKKAGEQRSVKEDNPPDGKETGIKQNRGGIGSGSAVNLTSSGSCPPPSGGRGRGRGRKMRKNGSIVFGGAGESISDSIRNAIGVGDRDVLTSDSSFGNTSPAPTGFSRSPFPGKF